MSESHDALDTDKVGRNERIVCVSLLAQKAGRRWWPSLWSLVHLIIPFNLMRNENVIGIVVPS